MPEQPKDPIHYEMKIPPEPDPSKEDQQSPAAEAHHDRSDSATPRARDAAGGGDKPRSEQPSE